jgi:hypothetical protein
MIAPSASGSFVLSASVETLSLDNWVPFTAAPGIENH